MTITPRWVHANKTKNGGWTRTQLSAIGVAWPPEKGWIGRVLGQEISEAQREAFECESARAQAHLAFAEGGRNEQA